MCGAERRAEGVWWGAWVGVAMGPEGPSYQGFAPCLQEHPGLEQVKYVGRRLSSLLRPLQRMGVGTDPLL